jgi:hypothetical protein
LHDRRSDHKPDENADQNWGLPVGKMDLKRAAGHDNGDVDVRGGPREVLVQNCN